MARWIRFFSERFPWPLLGLITAGFAWSSLASTERELSLVTLLLGWLQALLMFAVLRLMDEVKDYKKDVIAHPDRPLPRGLLSLSEARHGIGAGLLLMAGLAVLCALLFSSPSGWLYGATTLFLFGMYREFGLGTWLEPRPLLYAVSHQGITIILSASIASLAFGADPLGSLLTLMPCGVFLLGAFFSYEVARKLDPLAHPILRTYRSVYGDRGTGWILLFTTAISMIGSWMLFADTVWLSVFWAVELSILASYGILLQKHFKIIELLASISLLLHLWGPALLSMMRL